MKILLASLLLGLTPAGEARGGESFACNMAALTKSERTAHEKAMRTLLGAIQERKELRDGYAFRLPPATLVTASEWVALESRCCPFFAFEIELSRGGGPLWLRIRGTEGVKAFIRAELGF